MMSSTQSIQSVLEVNTVCLELEINEEVETEIEPETMKNEFEILECDIITNVEIESNISLPESEEEIISNEQKEISDAAEPSSLDSLEQEIVDDFERYLEWIQEKEAEVKSQPLLKTTVEEIIEIEPDTKTETNAEVKEEPTELRTEEKPINLAVNRMDDLFQDENKSKQTKEESKPEVVLETSVIRPKKREQCKNQC